MIWSGRSSLSWSVHCSEWQGHLWSCLGRGLVTEITFVKKTAVLGARFLRVNHDMSQFTTNSVNALKEPDTCESRNWLNILRKSCKEMYTICVNSNTNYTICFEYCNNCAIYVNLNTNYKFYIKVAKIFTQITQYV